MWLTLLEVPLGGNVEKTLKEALAPLGVFILTPKIELESRFLCIND